MTTTPRGFTLIELIVSVGLFALVMLMASGAYLVMLGLDRQTEAITSGIDTLSFALDSMTRSIRTGSGYNCNSPSGGNCSSGANVFYVTDPTGTVVSYARSVSAAVCGASNIGCLAQTKSGVTTALTDPSVNVSAIVFYASGVFKYPTDTLAPHVTVTITGAVSSGPGKTVPFTVETGATMRGTDI